MENKNILLSLSLCSCLLLIACQKNDQKVSASESQKAQKSENNHVEHKQSERDLMLEAIRKNQKALELESCAIDELDDDKKLIFVGDINHDGKPDFIYDYSIIVQCGGQGTSNILGIFLGDGKQYKFEGTYVVGATILNDLKVHGIDKKGIINGELNDEKVQYIYKNNTLEELEDPNKKVVIQLGKQMASENSPFATELDRMTYVADEVECGGFFPDDQAEKSTTIDHYDLHIANDQMVVMGVFGLTAKDQVQVIGKTVTSATTLSQVKQLFKKEYSLAESKNSTETIGAASEDATKLKYDVMLGIHKIDMDDSYLFYFKNNQLIAVQYFIPC